MIDETLREKKMIPIDCPLKNSEQCTWEDGKYCDPQRRRECEGKRC